MFGVVLNSKSRQFCIGSLCFLFGVGLQSFVDVPMFVAFGLGLLCVLCCLLFWNDFGIRLVCVFGLLFVFGIVRYVIAFPDVSVSTKGEQASIVGVVDAEPDVRLDGVRYIVRHDERRVYVKSGLYPRYSYGDRLWIDCHLKRPEPIEEFRYDMYLARFGVFAICGRPRIEYLNSGEGNFIVRGVLGLKERVAVRVNKLWHEPYASFMAGLLYGYRGGLGSLNKLFSRTGVTHIIAISGYNITIIASILMGFCIACYIPRQKAFWVIFVGIALFVLFAGLSASVVRAGIMGVIVLLARQLGRGSRVLNVMLLTAVVMTLHNPFILMWDAGFQLSFISTLGLVYLADPIERFFLWVPKSFELRESVVATFAAIIATLPLILFQFGRLSIVAPIVNVMILWLIPWLMLLGFVAVCVSIVLWPLAEIIAWVSFLGLEYIVVVVKWFAGLEWAAVDVSVPVWGMIGGYAVLVWIGVKLSNC